MPVSDGGAMLWPAPLSLAPQDGSGIPYFRYGFVDVNSHLVIPQRYDSYRYCPNADGRSSFLIVSAGGQNDEIYDLTGKLLLRSPYPSADCGGPDHIVIGNVLDAEASKHNDGLLNLVTGKIEVPVGRDRHVTVVDPVTVNVSDRWGEYFFDLRTGVHTPHSGYLDESVDVGDGGLLIAGDRRRDADLEKSPKLGVINRAGSWALKPSAVELTGFDAGYATISVDDKYTFLDQSLQRTGGTWDEIDAVYSYTARTVVGYQVKQGFDRGLLGMNLAPIVPPGSAGIDCDDATAICTVTENKATTMVTLPTGTKTPLPAGYRLALSTGIFADSQASEAGRSQRIFVVSTGQTITLAAPSSCEAVGSAWVSCEADVGMVGPVVINAAGQMTAFASVSALADPVPDKGDAYYWATSGGIEGFVDSNGTWRFQQSRFTQLED